MGKNPSVKDYGGASAHGRRRRTRISKETIYSFRCLDCAKLRYVAPRELGRAARPRCLHCGGPLEETAVSNKRHVERTDNVRRAKIGDTGGNEEQLDEYVKSLGRFRVCRSCGEDMTEEKKRCPGCGTLFMRNAIGCATCSLKLHWAMHPECRR